MNKPRGQTIEAEVMIEQEIQKSRFIAYLSPIADEQEAKDYLKTIKKLHPKATHHCSAFICDDIFRSNDDNEPSSSAGLPMLQVLKNEELDHVVAVVVRYYGGILLGVGGLIRAYSSSVALALAQAKRLLAHTLSVTELTFPYDIINTVENYLSDKAVILDRIYQEKVTYLVRWSDDRHLVALNDLGRGTITARKIKEEIHYLKEGDHGYSQ